MATVNCWRCLLRPSAGVPAAPQRIVPIMVASAQFSTSAQVAKTQAKASNSGGPTFRAGKKMQLGKFKKKKLEKTKSPAPGERKAFRKRIVLSNNNALVVPGLDTLGAESMADSANTGKIFAMSDKLVDQLRASEAFKVTQTWGLFRSPHVLLRSETADLAKKMQAAADKKESLRLVISGDRLSGKSTLLLQAMANGFLNEWIVVNIPEAQELTTACTEYAAIPGTTPAQWMQPNYALKMIQAIRKSNEHILSKLTVVKSHDNLLNPVPQGSTVLELADTAREADGAWAVFQALWSELTVKGEGRPPLLFALDGLSHIMKISDYRSPAFELIHSHDLAIVGSFVDMLAGRAPLPNGGAVIGAMSSNNSPRSASVELALAQRLAEQEGVDVPPRDPFSRKYDERVDAALVSVQVLKANAVTKTEARALMEYWAASGVLRQRVDERSVTESWTLGGNGVLGEMERASLLTLKL